MVGREVKAIDSEHRNNVPEDAWRWHQAFKQGLRPGHPATGFATGNLDTLLGSGSAAQGDASKLHAALLEFHETWYAGPRMALCVLGKEPLDVLEAMVAAPFAKVRTGASGTVGGPGSSQDSAFAAAAASAVAPAVGGGGGGGGVVRLDAPTFSYGSEGPYGRGAKVGLLRRVVPVADLRELSVTFPLQGAADKALKPHRYWSHVLGHEGEGSLHAALQASGLVEDLSAGLDLQHDDGAAFRVAMTLTELGEQKLGEVRDGRRGCC
jgi:insulysin